MRTQVAALLQESEITRNLLAVEKEKQRLEAELQSADRDRLEKDKEDWARRKEAEKRKAEDIERKAERERKKKEREKNERKWAAERKEKEEAATKKKEEEAATKKKEEEAASKGEKRRSSLALKCFEWDEPDDSDEEIDFHFEGRSLPPGMLELARDARRHQDIATNQNLAVAHTMSARKYMAKLRGKGEHPVSLVRYLFLDENLIPGGTRYYLFLFPSSFFFPRSGNIQFSIVENLGPQTIFVLAS